VVVPQAPGSDPATAGMTINVNALGILQCDDVTSFGCSSGFASWWIGCREQSVTGSAGYYRNTHVLNCGNYGLFLYAHAHTEWQGYVCAGPATDLNSCCLFPIEGSDYYELGLKFEDVSITGQVPARLSWAVGNDGGAFEGGTLSGYPCFQVEWQTVRSGNPSTNVVRRYVFDGVKFVQPPGTPPKPWKVIDFAPLPAKHVDLTNPLEIYILNYQGTGRNYRVYYLQQAADYVVPQTDPTTGVIGSPVAGLTNAELLARYGKAVGGAVAPASAVVLPEVGGLCEEISGLPPAAQAWYNAVGD
jgi:hypothetical protein